MTQPVPPASWLPAAFCASTAFLTGCSLEATGAGIGAGLVVGVGALAGYLYLSRLRGPVSNPNPPAVVLSTPTPESSPDPEPATAPQPDFQAKVAQWEKRLLDPSVPAEKAGPVMDILCRRGLVHSDEEIARASASLLDKVLSERRELITPGLAALLGETLEGVNASDGATDRAVRRGGRCCRLLFQIILAHPETATAIQAVDLLGSKGLGHPVMRIAQRAAGYFEELAEKGSKDPRIAKLITLAAVKSLIERGLKSDRGPHLARSVLDVLRTVALFSPDAEAVKEAFDALSIDGLQHDDHRIALLVAQQVTGIANKDHARVPMLPLVTLRLGLGRKAPNEMKLAFLEAIAHIAAPELSEPGPNRRVSEKALDILFQDALRLSDKEIADAARRHLVAVYKRRPDIFSQEMRETLATNR